jgi:hypothetical protein
MAEQTIVIGNATIVLNGPNDPFHDGYTTGYLEFYDERHLPFFPLTSRIVRDYLVAILAEPTHLVLWSARRMTGWIEALMENAPQTFRSDLPEEHMIALQNM